MFLRIEVQDQGTSQSWFLATSLFLDYRWQLSFSPPWVLFLFSLIRKWLEYSWNTILYYFLYSKVNQLYIYIYLPFLNFFFHIDHLEYQIVFPLSYTKSLCSFTSVMSNWDPIDCSLLGYSVRGIFQARKLECRAMPSSRRSSWLRNQTRFSCVSWIWGGFFTHWAT